MSYPDLHQPATLGYTNLFTYQTHAPPFFGTGVFAPMFAATPMRTQFARGNTQIVRKDVVNHVSCCDNYKFDGLPNRMPIDMNLNKMMRCKKGV